MTKFSKENCCEQKFFPYSNLQISLEKEKFFAAFANLIFTEYIQPRLLQIHCYMQPELFINFKGMPFSKDYTEDRGHMYALEDIKESKRVGPATKGACITCKTPYIEEFYNSKRLHSTLNYQTPAIIHLKSLAA